MIRLIRCPDGKELMLIIFATIGTMCAPTGAFLGFLIDYPSTHQVSLEQAHSPRTAR